MGAVTEVPRCSNGSFVPIQQTRALPRGRGTQCVALTEHTDVDRCRLLCPGAGEVAKQDRVLGDIIDQVLRPLSLLVQHNLLQGGLQTNDLRLGTAASTVDFIGISKLHCRLLTRPWKTGNTGQQMSPPPCTRSLIKEEEPKKKGQGCFCSSTRDPHSGLTVLHLDRGGWPRAVSGGPSSSPSPPD